MQASSRKQVIIIPDSLFKNDRSGITVYYKSFSHFKLQVQQIGIHFIDNFNIVK
jgi:hypothetical protein